MRAYEVKQVTLSARLFFIMCHVYPFLYIKSVLFTRAQRLMRNHLIQKPCFTSFLPLLSTFEFQWKCSSKLPRGVRILPARIHIISRSGSLLQVEPRFESLMEPGLESVRILDPDPCHGLILYPVLWSQSKDRMSEAQHCQSWIRIPSIPESDPN